MTAKLLLVASVLIAAVAQPTADKYPAGVDPSLCPNYPHCDNALLAARSQHHAGAYVPASPYVFPGAYAGFPAGAHAGFAGHGTFSSPGYPAGVNPASCPNYPFCTSYSPNAYHAAPLPGFSHRQYPDGVNPATCPNYPYCH